MPLLWRRTQLTDTPSLAATAGASSSASASGRAAPTKLFEGNPVEDLLEPAHGGPGGQLGREELLVGELGEAVDPEGGQEGCEEVVDGDHMPGTRIGLVDATGDEGSAAGPPRTSVHIFCIFCGRRPA